MYIKVSEMNKTIQAKLRESRIAMERNAALHENQQLQQQVASLDKEVKWLDARALDYKKESAACRSRLDAIASLRVERSQPWKHEHLELSAVAELPLYEQYGRQTLIEAFVHLINKFDGHVLENKHESLTLGLSVSAQPNIYLAFEFMSMYFNPSARHTPHPDTFFNALLRILEAKESNLYNVMCDLKRELIYR